MKRLINNGDIFDKYVSFEDKKFRDDTIKQFNWLGHRHIAGTYSGSAYTTSLGENYMANSLRNDSNPKGSLLVAAKNYTDEKVAGISTSAAVQQANAYTDTKFTEAKSYTDAQIANINSAAIVQQANAYTDTKFTAANDHTDTKFTEAKAYSDTKLNEAKAYSDTKLTAANDHTDTKFTEAKNYTDTKFTAAKNYTDTKVKYLYNHFINLQGSSGHVYVNYISEYASQYTIATLKNALYGKTLVCSGYLNGSVAEYITSEGGNLSVGVVDVSDGSTTGEIIDNTFSITDEVSAI